MAEMTNQTDENQNDKTNKIETSAADAASRRTFVKWIGQITAGVAVVGLGLGLANRSTLAHAAQAIPECTPCSGCVQQSCAYAPLCNDDGYKYKLTYIQYYGCVLAGQDCPYNTISVCQNNCNLPC